MKKVAIVTSGYKPVPAIEGGAVEQLTTVLIEENEKANHFCFDVYTLKNKGLDQCSFQSTTLIQVENRQRLLPIRAIFSIVNRGCKLLKIKKHIDYMGLMMPYKVKKDYSAIIVENNLEMFFRIKRKNPETPVIFHLHNDFDTVATDFDKTADRIHQLGKQADQIWVASKYLKRHLETLQLDAPIKVLENCINKKVYDVRKFSEPDREKSREKYGLKEEDHGVLFCGRMDRWKGALELVKAISLIKNKNIKLILAGGQWFGDKEEQRYIQEINQIIESMPERVCSLGYVDQEKLPEVYSAADVVAIPTQCTEAFGMTALEAITMGKPCVATANGGLCDILDENCACLINRDDQYVQNMADSIERICQSEELQQTMRTAACKKAQQFMNNEQYYQLCTEYLKNELHI